MWAICAGAFCCGGDAVPGVFRWPALTLLGSGQFDLVITDRAMVGQDDIERGVLERQALGVAVDQR